MVRETARLNLRLLGSFEARLGAGPLRLSAKKTRALLVFLALPPGRAHTRETLAGLLWGDTGDTQARNNLRHALVELRRALAGARPSGLLADGETLTLNPAGVDVDVALFERHVADGAPAALASAVELYRGDLLAGLSLQEASFDDWLAAERERLRELARGALGRLLTLQTGGGSVDIPAAIRTAGRLLALDPLQEDVHRSLMRLHVREGRRGAALRQYQLCVDVLRRELGVEPDPETKQLYRDLLQRPSTESRPPVTARPAVTDPRAADSATASPPAPEETALIGRGPEARRLSQVLDEAWKGRGHVALVLGEAGIGKSRLVRTLVAEARRRGARVLEGHAYETEQMLAFGPWVDLLRGLPLAGDAAPVEDLDPVWRAELARLLPELGGPGVDPAPASADHRRLFEAVGRLLTGLAASVPLVLVLEDLHWADETSLQLLAFVARRIRAVRVVMAATVRDEELASAPVLERVLAELGREPHVVRLPLGRLSETDTAELVHALARTGSGDEAARRFGPRVFALSEGNPFMVVETMRAWQEAAPSTAARSLALPERVRQVIAGRLSRLGERGRQLAAVAAVIGREFDFALAARAAGLADGDAAEGVEELVRRRLLHGVGERLAFTHDRIRDVSYLELLPARRRLLHGQVAAALEGLYAGHLEPHYAALGRHHRESQAWDRAVTYLRMAGEQAAAGAAHREAAASLEQALEALSHLPETPTRLEQAVDLRLRLRHHLFMLAEWGRIGTHLRQARTEVEALEDPRRLERVLAAMATHVRLLGRYREAIELSERGRALAPSPGSPRVAADHNARQASVWYLLGEHRKVIEVARQTLTLLPGDLAYEHFELGHGPVAFARHILAMSLAELGEFSEALAQGDESLRIAEAVGQPLTILAAHFSAGFVRLRMGALPDAVTVLERGLRLYDPAETALWSTYLTTGLGAAYTGLGRVAEAVALLEPAVEQFGSAGIVANHAMRLVWLGDACLAGGRTDMAARHAAAALDLARKLEERGHEAYALRLVGDVAAQRGPRAHEDAAARYHEALSRAEALGMRPLVAHCHLALARLHAGAGDRRQAAAALAIATTLYREMKMDFWRNRAEAVVDKAPAGPSPRPGPRSRVVVPAGSRVAGRAPSKRA